MESNLKKLIIHGCRGVPKNHGGFETFARELALYLCNNGWQVIVYCQEQGFGRIYCSEWCGVSLVHIPSGNDGALSTILFDFRTIVHMLRKPGIVLTLGYNTAIFNVLLRFSGRTNIINMDGIEWQRDRWGLLPAYWLKINEWLGSRIAQHLIADHPEIKMRLLALVPEKDISMIPYGGYEVTTGDSRILNRMGLQAHGYATVICRLVEENSILEIIEAFSLRERGMLLAIVGPFDPENNLYHLKLKRAAGKEVLFLGEIYQRAEVETLRFYSKLYIHGHTVGGSNPSLIEALAAGNATLARDNAFNRWVAKDAALYFTDINQADLLIEHLLTNEYDLKALQRNARLTFQENFTWGTILNDYEALIYRLANETD